MIKSLQNQNRLELLVAIGFSIIIFVLSSTEMGYIPISQYRSLDMGIIAGIFAAMIGGYRIGIPIAILWAYLGFTNPDSNLQMFTLPGLIIVKIVLVTVAYYAYKTCKRIYEFSPSNVYRALTVAITAKNIVSNLILAYVMIHAGEDSFNLGSFMLSSAKQLVLEIALCSLAMMLLIKHLRQIHILNGVKRREKAKAALKL